MTRLWRLLPGLLGLALCLQGSLALAQCLRLARPATLRVEICAAEGMRSIALPLEEEGQGEAAPHLVVCLACQGLADDALPAPAELPLPLPHPAGPPVLAALAGPVLGPRAPPYPPTGPPSSP